MEDDDRTLIEKSFSKIEATQKVHEQLLFKYCLDAIKSEIPEIASKAKELVDWWTILQTSLESSPKDKENKQTKLQSWCVSAEKFKKETESRVTPLRGLDGV